MAALIYVQGVSAVLPQHRAAIGSWLLTVWSWPVTDVGTVTIRSWGLPSLFLLLAFDPQFLRTSDLSPVLIHLELLLLLLLRLRVSSSYGFGPKPLCDPLTTPFIVQTSDR
jgi:hypothetical protein